MSGSTDWMSAVAILVSGLILGSMFVYYFARRKQKPPETDVELRDLEGKRDSFVRQLRELDDDGAKLTSQQLAEERTRLELETAYVLRAIDEHRRSGARVSVPERPPSADTRWATMIGFAWGAGSMAALALLGYFVMNAAEPRQQAEQAQTMGQPPQPAAGDPAILQMEQAVQKTPEDLNLRMQLAQAYLERENLMGVFEQTQYVLSKAPNDSRALTYQALVRMSLGQTSDAVEMLRRATTLDPTLLDAWVALAWVRTQEGNFKEAESAMQEAMRRHPEEKARLEQVLRQMKAHQNTGAQNPPPADGSAIRVTIDIDPSARARATGGVLYVIARAEGVTSGPPIAVKRVAVSAFPTTVELSSADSMMGQPLPQKVRVEARLDSDGDAATRNPSDLFAAQDSVAKGAAIRLALK